MNEIDELCGVIVTFLFRDKLIKYKAERDKWEFISTPLFRQLSKIAQQNGIELSPAKFGRYLGYVLQRYNLEEWYKKMGEFNFAKDAPDLKDSDALY